MNYKNLLIIPIIVFLTNCTEKEDAFRKINYNKEINVFENICKNLNPHKKYDYWAFIESRDFGESKKEVEILNEKGNLENRNLIDLNYRREGFFVAGHHSTYSFYILETEKNKVHEIRDIENLKIFLDKIDTKDEALLIAILNEFSIDNCHEEGGSYRKNESNYELLLFKSSVLKERQQYLVTVENSAEWDSIPKKIYCQRFEKCDCN